LAAPHTYILSFPCHGHSHHLHSFPTRRSSDLSEEWLTKPYFKTDRVNGTGDTLSAVITAELAKGTDLKTAVKIAKDFTYEAISHPINVGSKYGPINHLAAQEEIN